jgi:hypothetical protein
MDVEELAADMRPAGRLGDPVTGEQLVEAVLAKTRPDSRCWLFGPVDLSFDLKRP